MAIHLYAGNAIWTDCEPGETHSGRCLVVEGLSLEDAKAEATRELLEDLAAVDRLTEGDMVDA